MLFGVICPILYLLMGIAVYTIYQTPETPERKKAITLYWVQLIVNFLWPVVFYSYLFTSIVTPDLNSTVGLFS
ncbi:TspO/MBR family protein [Clostridium omnivorum]|uniref:TspO/MBR family protein n=1 Tax=Clostridium omnivorum TaxID=1604902 RepID=UPI0033130313